MIKTNVISQGLFSVPGIADLCSDVLYSAYRFRERDRSDLCSQNCWCILISYIDASHEVRYQMHVGRRTGQPVLFSRSSDADRLAASLNREADKTRTEVCA